MKVAISLPDALCVEVDARARRLRLSRSGLIATAAREWLARTAPAADATQAWNAALANARGPDAPEEGALRRYTRARVRRNGTW